MAVSFDPQTLSTPIKQTAQQAAQRTWSQVPPGTKDAVSQKFQQSSESLRGAKAQFSQNFSEQVSQRSEQAKQGVDGLGDRLGHYLGDKLHQAQGWMSQPVQHWLEDHQVVAWVVAHPILSAIALLLFAILSLNLLKAVLNPRNWLKVLSWPLRLAQTGLGISDEPMYFEQTLQLGDVRKSEVNAILKRLEALNKEQEILHGQLKELLASEAKKTKV